MSKPTLEPRFPFTPPAVIEENLPGEATHKVKAKAQELPQINGHQISAKEWNTFRLFVENSGYRQTIKTVEQSGFSRWTIWAWRKEPWWKWLEDNYIADSQRKTHLYLARRSREAAETLFNVMYTDTDDRAAGARVHAARTVLEVGNDPLIKKHPSLQINQNIINNHGTINIAKLRSLSPDKLHQIAETLEIPLEAKDF